MAPRKGAVKSQQGKKKQSGFQLPHNLGADKLGPQSTSLLASEQSEGAHSSFEVNAGTGLAITTTTRQLRPRVTKDKPLPTSLSTGKSGGSMKKAKTTAPAKALNSQLGFKVSKPLTTPDLKGEGANDLTGTQNSNIIEKDAQITAAPAPTKEDGDHFLVDHQILDASISVKREAQHGQTLPQETADEQAESTKKRSRGKTQNRTPYEKEMNGLPWHQTPFPDLVQPTAEACEEVHKLLAGQLMRKENRVISQPETVPPPSLEVAGCGEVPNILDALVRTLLSAATTFDNSDNALQSLIAKFGTISIEGPNSTRTNPEIVIKDQIDFMKIHHADVKAVEKAIECGGLGAVKSKFIKGILSQVYSENFLRVKAFRQEKLDGVKPDIPGVDALNQGQKDMEIWLWEHGVLSLDHHCSLDPEAAMNEFIKFPGIGVKTAACVILFCMRQPCFAVDTHVWRMCKWLNWAPAKADRNSAFAHLDVRVPDHLKYALHQLFIYHGKNCKKCKISNAKLEEDWENEECPLEHLLQRTERKKAPKRKLQDDEEQVIRAKKQNKKAEVPEKEELDVKPFAEEAVLEGQVEGADAAEVVLNPEVEDSLSAAGDVSHEDDTVAG